MLCDSVYIQLDESLESGASGFAAMQKEKINRKKQQQRKKLNEIKKDFGHRGSNLLLKATL